MKAWYGSHNREGCPSGRGRPLVQVVCSGRAQAQAAPFRPSAIVISDRPLRSRDPCTPPSRSTRRCARCTAVAIDAGIHPSTCSWTMARSVSGATVGCLRRSRGRNPYPPGTASQTAPRCPERSAAPPHGLGVKPPRSIRVHVSMPQLCPEAARQSRNERPAAPIITHVAKKDGVVDIPQGRTRTSQRSTCPMDRGQHHWSIVSVIARALPDARDDISLCSAILLRWIRWGLR